MEPATEKPRLQPTSLDIKAAILRFPGRLVTYQAFKKFSPRCLRNIQKQEYDACTQAIADFGEVVEICVPCCAQRLPVFIKKTPGEILNCPMDAPFTREEYQQRITEPLNRLITGECARGPYQGEPLHTRGHRLNIDLKKARCEPPSH